MFQTEPILFLQAHAHPVSSAAVNAVTILGHEPFILGVITFVLFGAGFRNGFLLLQVFLWTGLVTESLKLFFALPWPPFVVAAGMGADGFLALLPEPVVDAFRQSDVPSLLHYGFPSGHVANTVVFWGGLALLSGNPAWRRAVPLLVLLVAFSRVYLGRHFLADVVGGAALGAALLLVARPLMVPGPLSKAVFTWRPPAPAIVFFLVLPFVPAFFQLAEGATVGRLFAVNAAFLLLLAGGLPADEGTPAARAGRVVLAIVLYLGSSLLLEQVTLSEGFATDLMRGMVPGFLFLWGTTAIALRLGWARKEAVALT